MSMNLELWHLILLLLAFFGFVGAVAKIFFGQFDGRQRERFKALQDELQRHSKEEEKYATKLTEVERDLLLLRADLPQKFVLREDYIRNQTVLEAKLDTISAEIKNLQLQGAANG